MSGESGNLNRRAAIAAVSFWLPRQTLDNEQLSGRFPEWQVDKITSKTGIRRRHIAGEGETAGDLAFHAAEALFEEYGLSRGDIDFILLCTQSADYILPTTACLLQKRLNIPSSAGALDFNLGCSGYVYGLSLAKGLIGTGAARNVLLLTADTYTRFLHEEDKSCRTLFGDGAAATLISCSSEGWEIGNFVFGTDGGGGPNLMLRNGGSKYPRNTGADERNEAGTFLKNTDYLYMTGPEIFRFTGTVVPALVTDVLERNALSMSGIDWFVFHQANRYMLDMVRQRAGIPADKFLVCLEETGNTVSSTIPIALKTAWSDGRIAPGQKLLLAGFGVGYSWAGCVVGP